MNANLVRDIRAWRFDRAVNGLLTVSFQGNPTQVGKNVARALATLGAKNAEQFLTELESKVAPMRLRAE